MPKRRLAGKVDFIDGLYTFCHVRYLGYCNAFLINTSLLSASQKIHLILIEVVRLGLQALVTCWLAGWLAAAGTLQPIPSWCFFFFLFSFQCRPCQLMHHIDVIFPSHFMPASLTCKVEDIKWALARALSRILGMLCFFNLVLQAASRAAPMQHHLNKLNPEKERTIL